MSTDQHRFVETHYGPRAASYVTSAVHSAGADLDQIEAAVRDRAPARVLDLGCGGGHVSYRVAPHAGEVVACDITAGMLDQVRATAAERGLANIGVQQAPAELLPFEDGHFDMVLCRFSTHHWHDAEAGLREARRVLNPAGRAIVVDTVAPPHPLLDSHLQTLELIRDPSHVRNYSVADWAAMLGRAGFVLAGLTARKLRMEFDVWTARTRTPPHYVEALRALQIGASAEARRHFAIGEDGSFDLDSVTFELQRL